MTLRNGAAHSTTDHRGERAPARFHDGCGFGERPDSSILHDPYLKPNLGCVLQRQRSGSIRGDAERVGPLHEEP